MNAKTFVKNLIEGNAELFNASRANARKYFESNPSKEDLVDHFTGRMVNERMNMTEISRSIANVQANADPKELELLTKQAHDEAVHFRMVKEVIEHLTGAEVDMEATMAKEAAKEVADGKAAKGATLLEKYEATEDPVALALYQLIGEGRAEAVWDEMANCVEDDFISTRYAKIARDEGFHSQIGAMKLEKLIDADSSIIERVEDLAAKFRADLLHISEQNTQVA